MQSRQWPNHHNSQLRDSWDLPIPPGMPHQITTKQLQIPALETSNNGQSPAITARKAQMRNLNRNRASNKHLITTPIFWIRFYLQSQAKLVLRSSINQQCQPSALRTQFNPRGMLMERKRQAWRLATVASTSMHSPLLESQEQTIPTQKVELPVPIWNPTSRCLSHKWACKDLFFSAPPVR